MNKFLPQCFNDLLCIMLVILIVLMWVLTGMDVIALPSEVTGALIVTWTLMVQYYFRKRTGEK